MMSLRFPLFLLVGALFVACTELGPGNPAPVAPSTGSLTEVTGQGPDNSPDHAVVQFGLPDVGSGFPPDSGHDRSAHAVDSLVPAVVNITAGGSVTFKVPPGVHQIAIYEPGTTPADIDTGDVTSLAAFAGCAGPPVVNAPLVIDVLDDPTLEAAYPVPCFTPTEITHQFDEPGRHLVICAFLPHFNVKMYGWVTVRER
jgi:plastocyanin